MNIEIVIDWELIDRKLLILCRGYDRIKWEIRYSDRKRKQSTGSLVVLYTDLGEGR